MTLPITTAAVPLSPPANLRDLGGIPIGDGVLRTGFAIRADDLSLITDEGARSLAGDGLTGVIDLRSNEEVANTGRGPLAAYPVTYHHLSLVTTLGTAVSDSGSMTTTPATMGGFYAGLVENAAERLVTALAIIAYSPGATAFHCAAGADRTGVLAASLLLTLGAGDDAIVADYSRTGANMPAIGERLAPVMGPLMAALGYGEDAFAAAATTGQFSADSMRITLARLRERHGDPLAPLKRAGLSETVIAQLKARALAR